MLAALYLRGVSTSDFKDALQPLLGEKASSLPFSSVARMAS